MVWDFSIYFGIYTQLAQLFFKNVLNIMTLTGRRTAVDTGESRELQANDWSKAKSILFPKKKIRKSFKINSILDKLALDVAFIEVNLR